MEKLSIEEKARRYDEAIGRVNDYYEGKTKIYSDVDKTLDYLFPELKENKDESVKKSLIGHLKECRNNTRSEVMIGEYAKWITWLEKQSHPQVRTGNEWVNTIDDACNKRYSEEYAHGEYCHEQSFRWGFQEGVDWFEKHGEQKTVSKTEPIVEGLTTEFEKQVSHLIASIINKEYEYTSDFVKWTVNVLLNYAKHEFEKQGEQKPTDKVEPKFKVGDWIYHEISGNTCHINKIENGLYVSDEGATISLGRQNDWRLWTIQDVKDGDVLVGSYDNCKKPWIGIFKCISKDKPTTQFDSYCFLNSSHHIFTTPLSNNFFNQCNGHTSRYALPATKEQRELLFTKMKEAGYEWDAEKKELNKIEQKPTWNEEDEELLTDAIKYLEIFDAQGIHGNRAVPAINWLKSLKERMKVE